MTGGVRLLDLLAARSTEGLSEHASRDLDLALGDQNEITPEDFDLAAAAVDLAYEACDGDHEPLPESLRQRVLDRANEHFDSLATFPHPKTAGVRPFDTRYLGWYAAAAVLALALWSPWSTGPQVTATAPSLGEQRAQLIESAPDTVRIPWTVPEIAEYAGVTGDVVWSARRQAGFMRLRGLPATRLGVEQYQLWIVDPSRDEHPIDGGVFDVAAGADELIVPIDAKLEVNDPRAFAITLEQAGGVVVSDGPLLVIAPVEA